MKVDVCRRFQTVETLTNQNADIIHTTNFACRERQTFGSKKTVKFGKSIDSRWKKYLAVQTAHSLNQKMIAF